ncbi:CYIR protein [Plasmodium cynomolgi strain B]|uniref:CYIR protein n=1 Tax=Plasmodium cynomolgi (strain B) TaxID=1120755 RepID=K6V3K2_PLACD|nr:CYIR protein [Plasmodium cynomolgi strain B]GAB69950.1 CYIR protein [Plasmodium cynomolgi strain B]
MWTNVKNYLNYVNLNYKPLDITKYFWTLKLYNEKCLDLVICNEHNEDVTYEAYIMDDEIITQYKDFDAYKASSEPKKR